MQGMKKMSVRTGGVWTDGGNTWVNDAGRSVGLLEPAVSNASGLRLHSLPLWGRWPSAARSDEVVSSAVREPAVSNASGLRRMLGNSGFLSFLFSSLVLRLGCRDIPAQGLTPPLLPKQGVSPLDPFPLARSRGVDFICRFHCGCKHPLGNSRFWGKTLGCRPDPRRG